MYQTVIRFFTGQGVPLAAIKLIGLKRDELVAIVDAIERFSGQQGQKTMGVTGEREKVKTGVEQAAESLRLLVRALTPDAQLRGQLKATMGKMAVGEDAEYVKYLQLVAASVGTLEPQQLEDAGYDAALLTQVQAALTKLTGTTGATRDIRIDSAAATLELDEYFRRATLLLTAEDGLDALVHAQRAHPTRGELVVLYDQAREVIGTATHRRRPTYKGTTYYGAPLLVFDRQTTHAPSFTLSNRSGRGINLLYYTAETPDGKPTPGLGLVVKNRATHHLADYTTLGPAEARYLLVKQVELAGEGEFYVQA